MVARVAGWRLTQRVTGRSGPLARGCDHGFSVGVVCWMGSDLEGDRLEWKAGTRMISRVQCRSGNWLVATVAGDVCVSEREQPIESGTKASVSMMLEVGDGIRE